MYDPVALVDVEFQEFCFDVLFGEHFQVFVEDFAPKSGVSVEVDHEFFGAFRFVEEVFVGADFVERAVALS